MQPLIKGRCFKDKEITLTAYPVFMESCGYEYVPLLHHLLILHTHAYYTRLLSSSDADYAREIYTSIQEAVHEACEEYKVPWRVIGSGSDGIASRFKHQSMSTPRSYAVTETSLNVLKAFGLTILEGEPGEEEFKELMDKASEKIDWSCSESTDIINKAWEYVVKEANKRRKRTLVKRCKEAGEKASELLESIVTESGIFPVTKEETDVFFKITFGCRKKTAIVKTLSELPGKWFRFSSRGFEWLGKRVDVPGVDSEETNRVLSDLHWQDILHNLGKL